MSRIGKKPVEIPKGVEVTVQPDNTVIVKGPKGTLQRKFDPRMIIKVEDGKVIVERPNDEKEVKALHGTTRALINNMVIGVSQGFQVKLIIKGVGYRADLKGKKLVMRLGLSHDVEIEPPEGITIEVPNPDQIIIKGIDKEKVGQFAANVRRWRIPDPYKGKGIWYEGEHRILRPGKTAAK